MRVALLVIAGALTLGCTGGQSGTETPAPRAGSGGSGGSPVITIQGGGEGGSDAAGSGGAAGSMMASVDSGRGGGGNGGAGSSARGGTGGKDNGVKQAGSGGRDGFAPNAGTDDDVCACALAGRSALLRARLITLDDCALRAEVEEVLALPEDFGDTIAVGDAIDARRWTGCGDVPDLAAGDSALIVYVPPASGTIGDALVASWSDPLVFGQVAVGEPIALPRSDQDKLLERATCTSGFGSAAKGTVSTACP